MNAKSLFLPVGLILAVAAGLLFPDAGARLGKLRCFGAPLEQILVIAIFLVYGFRLRKGHLQLSGRFIGVLAAAVTVNLFMGPLAAAGAARLVGATGGFLVGLLVMSCVPTTLSSAIVVTETSAGNVAWAIILTVFLMFVGVVVTPFTVSWSLDFGLQVNVSGWPLLLKIVTLILLPLLAGILLRRMTGDHSHQVLDYAPSACIVLIVWMMVSGNAVTVRALSGRSIAMFTGTALLVHAALLAAALASATLLRLAAPEAKALVFVSAQKTLPIAVSVLTALPKDQVAPAMLSVATVVCILFHFSQILGDSLIAGMIRNTKGRHGA